MSETAKQTAEPKEEFRRCMMALRLELPDPVYVDVARIVNARIAALEQEVAGLKQSEIEWQKQYQVLLANYHSEVARLQDALRKVKEYALSNPMFMDTVNSIASIVDAALAGTNEKVCDLEIKRLQDALRWYGGHFEGCTGQLGEECSCGYDAALTGSSAKQEYTCES